jgi:hypothetical protein
MIKKTDKLALKKSLERYSKTLGMAIAVLMGFFIIPTTINSQTRETVRLNPTGTITLSGIATPSFADCSFNADVSWDSQEARNIYLAISSTHNPKDVVPLANYSGTITLQGLAQETNYTVTLIETASDQVLSTTEFNTGKALCALTYVNYGE